MKNKNDYTKNYFNKETGNYDFPSLYFIGQKVKLKTEEFETTDAYIRTVTFTQGKIRYSVYLSKSKTTLHNIDSIYIAEGFDESIEFDFDNYS